MHEAGGIKPIDLSIFRDASRSRQVNVTQTGGDVFITSSTTSDMAVLWGENFGAKERKFLRELLTSEIVCFSLQETFQIHVRSLWHQSAMVGGRRQGRGTLLLHDLKGELTTSWTWAKFIRPLYRQNFSVIAADLPGYGKSAMSQACSCPVSAWSSSSAQIITKILEETGMPRCSFCTVGNSAGIIIQMMMTGVHRLEGRHVLVNPIFDRNALFAHVGSDQEPPPGAKAGWRQEIKDRQMAAFIQLVRTAAIKLWFIFNIDGKHRELKSGKVAPNKHVQAEWEQAFDTHEFLVNACQNEFAAVNITMTDVDDNDLCEAQCGKKVPVRMLVPSRHLKASVARYLANYKNEPWQNMFTPNHMFQASLKSRLEQASNDSDDSDGDRLSRRSQKSVGTHAGKDPLRPRPISHIEEVSRARGSNGRFGTVGSKAIMQFDPVGQERNITNILVRHSSDTTLNNVRKTKDSSLSSAAVVAHQRLERSGAFAASGAVRAEALREQSTANWDKVRYEADLSYGVRKMFLDAFEASVDTYKAELEKEIVKKEAFQKRTGLRTTL